MRIFPRIAAASCLLIVAIATVCGDDMHARYFEQLRQRGLYSLAESEAVARLSVDDLPLAGRTEFSIELSRTLAEHAGYVSEDQRNEFWLRAVRTVQELLDRDSGNPRAIFLSAQVAAVHVVSGDWLRSERDVRPFDEAILSQAKKACTKAIEQLRQVEKALTDASPKKSATGTVPGHELRSLTHTVRWELGLAYRNRAELSPSATDERLKDLNEAEQHLRRLVGAADEPLQTRAKLLLTVCLRLRNERERASEALSLLEKLEPRPTDAVQDEITAERVHLLIDQNRVTDAAELLLKTRGQRQRLTGEMWFLQTRALIGLRAIALEKHQETLADRLAEQVAMTIEHCDEQVGGYWTRRCRQYWDNVRTAQKYGPALDSLMQQARADYTAGRIEDSLAAYDKAEKLALQQRQAELAMELGLTRASILLDDMRFEAAQSEFFRLDREYSDAALAPKAHLLGTYCLGRLYDDKRTQARRLAYVEALDRHLEKYSDDITANDARYLKALFEEQRLQASVALPLYLQVDAGHPRALEAMSGAARCYEVILRRMIEKRLPTEEFEREAIERLTSFLLFAEESSDKWTISHAEIGLRLASILLIGSEDRPLSKPSILSDPIKPAAAVEAVEESRYQQAERWLSRVSSFIERQDKSAVTNEALDRLKLKMAPLRIVALTGSGSISDAAKVFDTLSSTPVDLLNIVDRLGQFSAVAGGKRKSQIAALQLRAAERLMPQRSQLSAADNERLDRLTMSAYIYTGQIAEALPIVRKLAEQSSKDISRQREFAALLSELPQQEAQLQARQCWYRVEQLSKAGSAEWMTARLGILTAYIRLNQLDEARKLLQVTKILYPDLQPESLKARFDAIESQLQATKPPAP